MCLHIYKHTHIGLHIYIYYISWEFPFSSLHLPFAVATPCGIYPGNYFVTNSKNRSKRYRPTTCIGHMGQNGDDSNNDRMNLSNII